ncbi:JmjC domain-containing protein [Streptomyces griseorubiginosus]|uniref:JmjC domain-containing protein n=1 Tax=Streptomyces griseorubiginosus TaxID=67304 RepID=UPI0036E55716
MDTAYPWPPDQAFWTGTFPDHTTGRTTPFLFKGMIPAVAASPDDVLVGFEAIRRAHAAGTGIKAHARVYVGEERRDDLLPRALTAPSWDGGVDAFVPWMQDLAAAERFSLVINNLETVSPALAAGLGTFLKSVIDGWGLPLGGAEQVAFAGNYSGTAFGIHEGYEDAFLVHLGPNAKNFYCWPAEQYEKLTGGKQPTYGDYRALLEEAEHFLLEPGDALFLPRRVFHVGTQDTFSVSVAMPLYTYPYAQILQSRIIPDILAELAGDGPDDPLNEPSAMADVAAGPGSVADRLAGVGHELMHFAADRVRGAAREHAEQRWATLLSNGGWELVEGDLARREAADAFDPQLVVPGAEITLIAPYQVTTLNSGDDTQYVLLRGHQTGIVLDVAALDQDTVTALNDGAAITLPDSPELLAAVRALGATGGLHLTPRPADTEDTEK